MHQSDSASNHPHPAFFSARLAAPYFEINVLRSKLFNGQKSGSSYKSVTYYCTFSLGAANDAENVRVDTARGKDNDQQNLSEMIMWHRSVYNQTASEFRCSKIQ